jgi:hypothetical protein
MQSQQYELNFLSYIESAVRTMKAQPFLLGNRPGGFIGKLAQTRVLYDSVEAETDDVLASGSSLVNNLNRIRYRLGVLESGGTGSGVADFLALTDTPDTYSGFAGQVVIVKDTEDGLEFDTYSAGGANIDLSNVVRVENDLVPGDLYSLGYPGEQWNSLFTNNVQLQAVTSMTNPSASGLKLAAKTDNELYMRDKTGVEKRILTESDIIGSGSGGHVIVYSGTEFTARLHMEFAGTLVVTDDVASNTTIVTGTVASGIVTFDFAGSTTTNGQDYNRTSGGTYTAHRAFIHITQPIKLHQVLWDVSSAATYNLKVYKGWSYTSTPILSLGDQVTGARTADVTWDANDTFLNSGRYIFELTWTGAKAVDDNTADSPNYFDFFSIERTQYDTSFETAYSAAIKLVAYLGTETLN